MNFEIQKDGVTLHLSEGETERIKTVLNAVGNIPNKSLEMGVVEQAMKLAAEVIENKKEVPVMLLKEAVMVDLILRVGLDEDNAEATTREKKKPEGSAGKSSPAPLPGTSL